MASGNLRAASLILASGFLLGLPTGCADGRDPLLTSPAVDTLRASRGTVRLYLNRAYSMTRSQPVATDPARQGADFALLYDLLAPGNKYFITTPLEKRLYRMDTVAAGTPLSDVGFAQTYDTNLFLSAYDLASNQVFTVYTQAGLYGLLRILEFANTGNNADSYVTLEWRLQLDGGNRF